ncbi:MAG: dienelactone hydrolase family protein [Pyrinomonadaceae bacterium]|nr:dienelactone hydrolase family protein [Pyrinomonadaceae bacterium]
MIKTETIEYNSGDNIFQGTICFDDEIIELKPGVLVVHMFKGHTDFEVNKAKELAELGYVGFAIDMYGKEFHGVSPEDARVLMNELNANRPLLLERILLALETLKVHSQVDKNKLGGIGFCFGGKCVLDLARANAEIKGVVSFHGVYDKPPIEQSSSIKPSILVLHGWDDPLGTPSQLLELANELTERKADWQILSFGNTGHSFANPAANSPESGLVYNELSNNRAWVSMKNFLKEMFL